MNQMQVERPRVVIKDTIHEDAPVMLENAGWNVGSFDTKRFGNEELIEAAYGAYAVITRSEGVPEAVLEIPTIQAVGMTSIDTSTINVLRASERDIAVYAGTDQSAISVAELGLGHAIDLKRHIREQQADHAAHKLGKRNDGHTIHGSQVRIIGYGRIGQVVGTMFEALGAHVGFYDSDETKQPLGRAVRFANLFDMLRGADTVSIHVPGAVDKPVIGAEELAAIGPQGIVINMARANSVDTGALIHAVKEGIIDGAAVDVFEDEPPKGKRFDSPYEGIPRIRTSAHNGGGTVEAQRDLTRYVVGGLIEQQRDGDTSRAVNHHMLREVAKAA